MPWSTPPSLIDGRGALFSLTVSGEALLHQHGKEDLILSEHLLGVPEVFLVLSELLVSIRSLLRLGVNLSLMST